MTDMANRTITKQNPRPMKNLNKKIKYFIEAHPSVIYGDSSAFLYDVTDTHKGIDAMAEGFLVSNKFSLSSNLST